MLNFIDFRGRLVHCSNEVLEHIRNEHFGYSSDTEKSVLYNPNCLPRLLEICLKFGDLYCRDRPKKIVKGKAEWRLEVRVHTPVPIGFDARFGTNAYCLTAVISVPENVLVSFYPVSCHIDTCWSQHFNHRSCKNLHIVRNPGLSGNHCFNCHTKLFSFSDLEIVPCKLNSEKRQEVERLYL